MDSFPKGTAIMIYIMGSFKVQGVCVCVCACVTVSEWFALWACTWETVSSSPTSDIGAVYPSFSTALGSFGAVSKVKLDSRS